MVLGWGKKPSAREKEDDDEMSMEEILASIRRYVAEDQKTHEPKMPQQTPMPEQYSPYADYPAPDPRAQEPQFVSSSPIDTGDSYDVKDNLYNPGMIENQSEVAHFITPSQQQELVEQAVEKAIEESKSMTSPETISASAAALSRLVEATRPALDRELGSSAGLMTLDRLITDLARPMVRDWLDHHLPQIVEAMVAREIEKITNRVIG